MAVDFVQEITGRDGKKDVDTNGEYRRTWIVRTSVPQDGASVVLAAPGIPLFNDPYQYLDDSDPLNPVAVTDDTAVAVSIRATQENVNDPLDWRVFVDYTGVEDPTAQPAEVEYSPTRYQKALTEDINGFAAVNSAGDPFESGLTVDRTRFTLTITKAVLDFDPAAMLAYQDSLNQNPFLAATHPPGFAAGTCKITMGAKRVRRKGTATFYWLRTAVIDIDREGWRVKVRDAGFNEIVYDGVTPTGKRKILDVGGVPVSTPWPLDTDGVKVPHDSPVPAPLEFDGYETKDWSAIPGLEY